VPEPEDGLGDGERLFLQTHGAAMVACAVGWFVSALFASVAYNWTFYYVLGLAVCGRDVIRARARAYARLKSMMDPKSMPFDTKRMIYGGFKKLVKA